MNSFVALAIATAGATAVPVQGQFQPTEVGRYTLSHPVCKDGILGIHIASPASSEPIEANIYFNLRALCSRDDDDSPTREEGKLPPGVQKL